MSHLAWQEPIIYLLTRKRNITKYNVNVYKPFKCHCTVNCTSAGGRTPWRIPRGQCNLKLTHLGIEQRFLHNQLIFKVQIGPLF